jgi:hypothetical protein
MARLSYVALVSGVLLSFHDTHYLWALACVAVWATLASLSNLRKG